MPILCLVLDQSFSIIRKFKYLVSKIVIVLSENGYFSLERMRYSLPDPLLHQIPLPPAAPNPRCLHACTLCQHHDPAPSLAAPLLLCLCTLQQLQTN
ncbi:hypothetical protein SLEP1_g42333 [Rubroshorea leprosula]|uniref:Uncharacterized protein n=1 Tax=Rubroshorea leprosula TaxID=152421 RepID=A0AAV5L9W6_9ROSI|nr:hypothetical protein SLEP1_g42333 [Rubroshorea leprosula]